MASRGFSRKRALGLILAAVLATALGFLAVPLAVAVLEPSVASTAAELPVPYEREDGLYFSLVDEGGQTVLQTGLFVVPGDEFVAEDNRHYRVVAVEGDRAQAVCIGTFALEEEGGTWAAGAGGLAAAAPKSSSVGIYHSHGDESYVIGDGTSSIRNRGGIDDVAQALIAAAERAGVKTNYADQGHAPHDSGAYRRSRRTATSLLRRGAGTLLDVHRDTAPRPTYSTEIQGRATAKVMLVVGRANPAKQATLSFVRTVKRTLDQTYPGLVRGIYFGRGSYNQDLSPRSVLLEIGSHRTPKAEAQQAATFIGLALPEILGAAGLPAGGAGRASWSNLGWIVLLVALGAGAYLVYASGGLRPALAKLRGFTRGEFGSMLAPRQGRSPRRSGRDGDRGSGEAGGGQR